MAFSFIWPPLSAAAQRHSTSSSRPAPPLHPRAAPGFAAAAFQVTKLCDLGANDCVTSVAWTQRGTHLAVGTNKGSVEIWEAAKCKRVRTMQGHAARVGTMSWNSHTLASGSRDRNIFLRDVRVKVCVVTVRVSSSGHVCGRVGLGAWLGR